MIKIDYDYIAYGELMKRVDFIIHHPICSSVKIYQSPSGDGYHLFVKPTKELTWDEKIYYRNLFKDDGQRIVFDLLKYEQSKDVLFSMRMKKGMIFEEILIEEITVRDKKITKCCPECYSLKMYCPDCSLFNVNIEEIVN